MPKVNSVAKCRKSPGTCGKCGVVINVGDPYLYWEFRFGGRRVRCAKPECRPKASDLTQSEFWGGVYSLQEQSFGGETLEDLESEKGDIVSQLEELRDSQEEKKSNMPEGLQEGDTGNLLQERYDALDECVNAIEGVDTSWEEPTKNKDESEEDFEERKATELKDRLEEIWDEISSALGEISCS